MSGLQPGGSGAGSSSSYFVPGFRASARMRPYLNRLRLQLHIVRSDERREARLREGVTEMQRILENKSVSVRRREEVINLTLLAAARRRFEPLRRLIARRDHDFADQEAQMLLRRLKRLVKAIIMLPDGGRGRLNKVLAKYQMAAFDTETFVALTTDIAEVARSLSPQATAERIVDTIYEPLPKPLPGVVRTGPSELIDGWEIMPPATRTVVEAHIASAPSERSIVNWLQSVIDLIETFSEGRKRGRHRSLNREYTRVVARIWERLGLVAGRANIPDGPEQPTAFQDFCNAALLAVGAREIVSGHDVRVRSTLEGRQFLALS